MQRSEFTDSGIGIYAVQYLNRFDEWATAGRIWMLKKHFRAFLHWHNQKYDDDKLSLLRVVPLAIETDLATVGYHFDGQRRLNVKGEIV